MVEIVQNNNMVDEPVYEGTCPSCKSILRFTYQDTETNIREIWESDPIYGDFKTSLICPCCRDAGYVHQTHKIGILKRPKCSMSEEQINFHYPIENIDNKKEF